MVAADSCVLVVVLPRREDEQLPSGASLHPLPARFGQVGEAVLLQIDKGEPCSKAARITAFSPGEMEGDTSTAPSAAAFVK